MRVQLKITGSAAFKLLFLPSSLFSKQHTDTNQSLLESRPPDSITTQTRHTQHKPNHPPPTNNGTRKRSNQHRQTLLHHRPKSLHTPRLRATRLRLPSNRGPLRRKSFLPSPTTTKISNTNCFRSSSTKSKPPASSATPSPTASSARSGSLARRLRTLWIMVFQRARRVKRRR